MRGAGGADNLPVRRGETRHAALLLRERRFVHMTAGDGVTLGRHVGRQRSARAARCTATASLRHPVAAVPLSGGRRSLRSAGSPLRNGGGLCRLRCWNHPIAAASGETAPCNKVRRADGAHGVARAVMVCGMTSHDDHLAALVDALRDAESGDAAPARRGRGDACMGRVARSSHTGAPEHGLAICFARGGRRDCDRFNPAWRTSSVRDGCPPSPSRRRLQPSSWLASRFSTASTFALSVCGCRRRRCALGVRSTASSSGDVDVDVDIDVIVGEDGVARGLTLNP